MTGFAARLCKPFQYHGSGTPLHDACRNGCKEEIGSILLESGCKLNSLDKVLPTNFSWTSSYLFTHVSFPTHASPPSLSSSSARVKTRCTPLHVAALHGNNHLVTFLLNKGAEIDPRDVFGRTPLHFACTHQGKTNDAKKSGNS